MRFGAKPWIWPLPGCGHLTGSVAGPSPGELAMLCLPLRVSAARGVRGLLAASIGPCSPSTEALDPISSPWPLELGCLSQLRGSPTALHLLHPFTLCGNQAWLNAPCLHALAPAQSSISLQPTMTLLPASALVYMSLRWQSHQTRSSWPARITTYLGGCFPATDLCAMACLEYDAVKQSRGTWEDGP